MKRMCGLYNVLLLFCVAEVIDGRSLAWYLDKPKTKLQTLFKRGTLHRELRCPLFIGIISGNNHHRKQKRCGPDYYSCSSDEGCGPGLKCCYDGCVYICTIGLKPKGVEAIDWVQEPRSQRISGDSWLDMNDVSVIPSKIECSNSDFPGLVSLRCPSGYKCIIETEEDKEHGIPSRGQCIRYKLPGFNSVDKRYDWENTALTKKDCTYRNQNYKPGQYFFKGCNFCFCHEGVMHCQLSPCPEQRADDHSKSDDEDQTNPLSKIEFKV